MVPRAVKKVLIIEDDPFLLEMYDLRLKEGGYLTFTAKNGQEGFDLARQNLPNLILLDILMPQVDGYQALRNLKKNPQTKKIPVVIFSNLSQKEEIEKGLKLGANDFIIKTSLTPTELSVKIKEYFK